MSVEFRDTDHDARLAREPGLVRGIVHETGGPGDGAFGVDLSIEQRPEVAHLCIRFERELFLAGVILYVGTGIKDDPRARAHREPLQVELVPLRQFPLRRIARGLSGLHRILWSDLRGVLRRAMQAE